MEWEFKTFGATAGQPGREQQSPTGVLRFPPKPALPRRDSYFATIDASDWDGVTQALVEYWLKVAEVFPRYYAGRDLVDPLAGKPRDTLALDNGWNRIVCLLDVVQGQFTTNLWKDIQRPPHLDRVWVIARFPMIESAFRRSSEDLAAVAAMIDGMHAALADAARREPARSALAGLRRWREFDLWTMETDDEGTLRPLFDRW